FRGYNPCHKQTLLAIALADAESPAPVRIPSPEYWPCPARYTIPTCLPTNARSASHLRSTAGIEGRTPRIAYSLEVEQCQENSSEITGFPESFSRRHNHTSSDRTDAIFQPGGFDILSY